MKKFLTIALSTLMILTIFTSQTASVFAMENKKEQDIVDIAVNDSRFTTLVEGLKAAGLVDTLKGEGPFTVFAPTNDAFEKLPDGTLEELLKAENKDKLTDILLYHVAKGKFDAKEVSNMDGKQINLANGKTANISVKDGEVFINDSKVIITDIMAKNGIIHVIDTVLLP
ncbi:MAG: fasciclin domain-containing protein [Terrisporobacter othiniensis]|uniref:fasciclin domain-containing protein n=1 Tax=Terrisporobacter petrolearius TaxID=1460447 RepID=UPI0008E6DF94|nr:fasciclin domain-containing protein [Terrisporobacter petrolearius]MDU4861195.1 fasciclin domain-containing protein [Terrisporobacter othiniensis]MDU6994829.1 fasciclin domain-containing protein [Terrisporobacter othiniensis]SFJ22570.1 Uncaracterized surface protein containing fasciclin (FAS1) repeats [Terrisporobacter glycolicus]